MDNQHLKREITNIILESPTAITADKIYELLLQQVDPGRTQETIRLMIRELVNDDNNLIGSSNKGYFLIKEEEDLENAKTYLSTRIGTLQKRIDNLDRLWQESHSD